MQRLVSAIERLLVSHDCVVVPGFGGFIKESLAPHCDLEKGLVYPGSLRYFFSAELKERDNLLDNYYARKYGISLRRARLFVDEDVRSLEATLYSHKHLKLGRLGQLSVQDEGSLLFSPLRVPPILGSGDFYGFTALALPMYLNNTTIEKRRLPVATNARGKYITLRIHKGVASVAAAAVIGVALVFSLPRSSSLERNHYTAGFASLDDCSSSLKEEIVASNEYVDSSVPILMQSLDAYDLEQESLRIEKPEEGFYVVVGSFKQSERAERFIEEIKHILPLHYIKVGSNYLVVASHFAVEVEASRYALSLRDKAPQFAQAWVYKQKSV